MRYLKFTGSAFMLSGIQCYEICWFQHSSISNVLDSYLFELKSMRIIQLGRCKADQEVLYVQFLGSWISEPDRKIRKTTLSLDVIWLIIFVVHNVGRNTDWGWTHEAEAQSGLCFKWWWSWGRCLLEITPTIHAKP